MDALNFSINPCKSNPYRWYIYFSITSPFNMEQVKKLMIGNDFTILADTPSVIVFRSSIYRLTWHRQGMIQIDIYTSKETKKDNIEQLINHILEDNSVDIFR